VVGKPPNLVRWAVVSLAAKMVSLVLEGQDLPLQHHGGMGMNSNAGTLCHSQYNWNAG
jgi:hypothetical protein